MSCCQFTSTSDWLQTWDQPCLSFPACTHWLPHAWQSVAPHSCEPCSLLRGSCFLVCRHGHAALAKAVARYKLTPAELGSSTGSAMKRLNLQDAAKGHSSPGPAGSARTIQSPQLSESFREARTALQHHLEYRGSSGSLGSPPSTSPSSDYEASVESGPVSAARRVLKLSPSEQRSQQQRQKLADRQREFKQKQKGTFSNLRPSAADSDWDTASVSTLSDESQANMPGPHTPLPHPRAAASPAAANGVPHQDQPSSPEATSTSTMLSYRSTTASTQPRVVVNITVVNDMPFPSAKGPQSQRLPQSESAQQPAASLHTLSDVKVPHANGHVTDGSMPTSPFASADSQQGEQAGAGAKPAVTAASLAPSTESQDNGGPSPGVSRELFPAATAVAEAAADDLSAHAQQLPAAHDSSQKGSESSASLPSTSQLLLPDQQAATKASEAATAASAPTAVAPPPPPPPPPPVPQTAVRAQSIPAPPPPPGLLKYPFCLLRLTKQ